MRAARFEVVRTDAGWTARFRAYNGKVIFSTGSQVYSRRIGALNAIAVLARTFSPTGQVWLETVEPSIRIGTGKPFDGPGTGYSVGQHVPIRYVDERTS